MSILMDVVSIEHRSPLTGWTARLVKSGVVGSLRPTVLACAGSWSGSMTRSRGDMRTFDECGSSITTRAAGTQAPLRSEPPRT
jgi:hypothetical protein